MEIMQEFIDFVFYEIWCKANSTTYSIDLYKDNQDLFEIMNNLYLYDLSGKIEGSGKFFYESINDIYLEFQTLSDDEINEYKIIYISNNNIENICTGDINFLPIIYAALNPTKASLNIKLENFFKNLYSSGFLALKGTYSKVGTLRDLYKSFVKVNNECICPFCGIFPIDGEFDETRDAFDHFLPKSKYPFNSINLKNLIPSCHKCNSSYKLGKDPVHDDLGNRKKTFYPFSTNHPQIEVSLSIAHNKWDQFIDEDIYISFGPNTFSEELETWNTLFHVKQRYAAKCSYKNGGKGWLNRIFVESKNYGKTPPEMLEAEIASATESPWFESQFLKKAFLLGCREKGLFKNQTTLT